MTQIKATLIDHMGSDLSIVNAARVSFGRTSSLEKVDTSFEAYDEDTKKVLWVEDYEYHLSDRDTKLIKYLAKHEHLSPFGHCFASFHIKAPIFVARQLVKHKFLRWNEISRRYVDEDPEFYVPDVWRGRSKDKKQGSEGRVVDYESMWGFEGVDEDVNSHNQDSLDLYRNMVRQGVAPEQARMVLPQSTMTEWYWSGSMDAFASMCNLRLKSDTQYESRLVAQQINETMKNIFPVSWEALVVE